jgi:NADH-quinone oxidoreductase subunit K
MIGLAHFLTVSALLFAMGVLAILLKRNAIGVLMGIELILNAAGINFVAFSHFQGGLEGQVITLFIIILAAAEAAVALAIVFSIYHNFQTVNVDQVDRLKG